MYCRKNLVVVQLLRAQPVRFFSCFIQFYGPPHYKVRTRFGHCVPILLSKYNIFDGIDDIKIELPAIRLIVVGQL